MVISTEMDQVFLEYARCLDLDIAFEFHAIFPRATGSSMTAAAHPLGSLQTCRWGLANQMGHPDTFDIYRVLSACLFYILICWVYPLDNLGNALVRCISSRIANQYIVPQKEANVEI